jgi:hypothetical protein
MVEPLYMADDHFNVTWTFQSGKLPQVEYHYSVEGENANLGAVFSLPPENIQAMTWRGRGPQRVWRNRLAGPQMGVWRKQANDSRTGMDWHYPEFRGYHSDLYWVRVQDKSGDFTVYTGKSGTFLQMLRPTAPDNQKNGPEFPEAELGFLSAISPIGTKIQKAGVLGPSGGPNRQVSWEWESGRLYFDLRPHLSPVP